MTFCAYLHVVIISENSIIIVMCVIAAEYLEFAFKHCYFSARKNKRFGCKICVVDNLICCLNYCDFSSDRLILMYLIPVKMLLVGCMYYGISLGVLMCVSTLVAQLTSTLYSKP